MGDKSAIQGEGDRESAKRYNKDTQEFVESGKVDEAARRAGDADSDELEKAEREGESRAKELDPDEERDYTKPTR
jgi:hypothetical protein